MIPWPDLPYALIGQGVVALVAVVIVLVGVIVSAFAVLFIWIRGLQGVSNYMWKGYEPGEEHPPLWKVRIAAIATSLYTFKIWKMPAAYREAKELAGEDLTLFADLRRRLEGGRTND